MQQRYIVLFGAPGVGKGTYSKLISKDFGIPVFSMGDYFRQIINNSDADSKSSSFIPQLRDTLRSGRFVNDDTVLDVIKRQRDLHFKDHKALLLDGVPRTVEQAKRIMDDDLQIDLVVEFKQP